MSTVAVTNDVSFFSTKSVELFVAGQMDGLESFPCERINIDDSIDELSESHHYVYIYASPEFACYQHFLKTDSYKDVRECLTQWKKEAIRLIEVKQLHSSHVSLLSFEDLVKNKHSTENKIITEARSILDLDCLDFDSVLIAQISSLFDFNYLIDDVYKDLKLLTNFIDEELLSFSKVEQSFENDLEKLFSKVLSSSLQLQELNTYIDEMNNEKESLLDSYNSAQERIDKLSKQNLVLESSNYDLESESKLALLQIHQLQEALEENFLEKKKLNTFITSHKRSSDSISIFSHLSSKLKNSDF